ncbi:MAG: hypothetical protein M3O70_19570 [Actinomycetota bacterium]|nr:hypothetical protein [Actinomycetota bacterium]
MRVRPTLTALALLLTVAACTSSDPRAAPTAAGTTPSPSATERTYPTTPPSAAQAADATPSPSPTRQAQAHAAWVAVEDDGVLSLIDLDDGRTLEQHTVGGGPHNITVAPDGTVAAALYASDAVAIVTPDGEVRQVELGGRPHDVKPAGDRFVVANEAGRRIEILSTDGQVQGRISLDFEPHDLSVTPDGPTAWVTLNGSDRLAQVDLTAQRVRRYVATGRSPHDIRIGDDGRIWVTDWTGPLHVFDPEGNRLTTLELGQEAHHLAFTPHGDRLWLVDHATRQAYIIDTATVEVADQVAVPGAPHHVAITGDGALAAIADHTNGTIVVYDAQNHARLAQIPVGNGPHGVWDRPID